MRRYLFPIVVGICVITGLIIVDVSQHISPGPSLTAQERRPSRSRSKAPKNGSKPPAMIPAASTGCGGPRRKPLCEIFNTNTALPFLAPLMMAHATPWASSRRSVSPPPALG